MGSLDTVKQYIMKTLSNYSLTKANLAVRAELANVGLLIDELNKHNGWISIDDGLPKNQQEVLVCNINSKHFNCVRLATFNENSPNSGFLVKGWLDEPKDKITHWHSIPKLPKE